MKCPDCTRQLECVPVKKDGMWSNHWECKEHGKVNHKSSAFESTAKGLIRLPAMSVIDGLLKQQIADIQEAMRRIADIDHIPLTINIGDEKKDINKNANSLSADLDKLADQFGLKRKNK